MGPDRRLMVARELTKHFEELVRGTTSSVLEVLQGRTIRGEFTLVLAGYAGVEPRRPRWQAKPVAHTASPDSTGNTSLA